VRAELRFGPHDAVALQQAQGGFAQLGYSMRLSVSPRAHWLEVTIPNTRRGLNRALTVLQGLSELQLRKVARAGSFPTLYGSGVHYEREPRGREWWQTAADNFAVGSGDCEDLANHRAAELVVYEGEPARAVTLRTGHHSFHAVVLRDDGTIEDPSAKLGMYRRGRAA
jgi:hypothetical protein